MLVRNKTKRTKRGLVLESLETRKLMAADTLAAGYRDAPIVKVDNSAQMTDVFVFVPAKSGAGSTAQTGSQSADFGDADSGATMERDTVFAQIGAATL